MRTPGRSGKGLSTEMAGPTEYSAATSENIAAQTASSAARSLTDDKTLSNGKFVVTVQEIMQALE